MTAALTAERLVFVDLETGGLHVEACHPVIQIAAIAVDAESLSEIESFEMNVEFDPAMCDPKALGINKFDPDVWAMTAIPSELVTIYFADYLRRHATVDLRKKDGSHFRVAKLVAHNAAFDVGFLHGWYRQHYKYLPAARQALCTLQRALWLFQEDHSLTPPADYKLGTLAEYFGVRTTPDHTAMNDIRATIELYRVLKSQILALTANQRLYLDHLSGVTGLSLRNMLNRAINAVVREMAN
ncbi:3'-5' exonuclease [Bythopirellula goksoeyrii]|uniref:Exonuclease domain-containing protein n=1 Tax=Bythopirellula goksoeyrii TaxID=1400387 RepID=A0A5B9QF22_9BACT|nr:3'-5' exonuclease [Bythopirellula goksoeyrii]QEG36240.1 hypothetical protein Pr1d_35520 [Bythopirellula goksoeyrii]